MQKVNADAINKYNQWYTEFQLFANSLGESVNLNAAGARPKNVMINLVTDAIVPPGQVTKFKASEIPFTPDQGILSVNVQDAIVEVKTDLDAISPLAHSALTLGSPSTGLSLAAGQILTITALYAIPLATDTAKGVTAYGWGNPSGVYLPIAATAADSTKWASYAFPTWAANSVLVTGASSGIQWNNAAAMKSLLNYYTSGDSPSFGTGSFSTSIKILEGGATPTKYSIFQGGDQLVDLTYTLPIAYPAVTGYVLSSTDAGVMSWIAGASGVYLPLAGGTLTGALAINGSANVLQFKVMGTAAGQTANLIEAWQQPASQLPVFKVSSTGDITTIGGGYLRLGSNSGSGFYTSLQYTGTAAIAYTLPATLPGAGLSGFWKSSDAGVLSFDTNTYLTSVAYANMPSIAQYSIIGRVAAGSGVIAEVTSDGTATKYLNGQLGFTVPATAAHNLLSAIHGDTLTDSVLAGDILIGNATPKWARLAKGTDNYVLTIDSVTHLPTWKTVKTALNSVPTVQKFTSSTGTYTTPAGVLYIKVRMVGGGGGGGGGGTGGGTGGTGGTSTFGTTLLSAVGGIGGTGAGAGGAGGTASLGTGPIGVALSGGSGGGGTFEALTSTQYPCAGAGAASPFGGAGGGQNNAAGYAGITNTGSGGGGGSAGGGTSAYAAGGGGAGGYIEAIITSPGATYSYAVGAAGTAGATSTGGYAGGAGSSGIIIVEEYYQ
jgi:hypothetical protein